MPTIIKGQPTSAEIRAEFAAKGEPMLLSFSCGKDSIASWLAMQDAGIEVVPVYIYYLPGFKFVADQIDYFEQHFQTKIHQYPHPSLFRWLNRAVFQAPERLRFIEAAELPEPDYATMWDLIRADLDMPDAWIADGVRAADSIMRRASFVKHGISKPKDRKVSVIADWLKAEVLGRVDQAGIELPIDYQIWGRSFDGLDRRFTEPMREHLPDDYALLKSWFPLVDMDIVRGGGDPD